MKNPISKMRLMGALLLSIGALAAVQGCTGPSPAGSEVVPADIDRQSPPPPYYGSLIHQWSDPESGCVYLVIVHRGRGAITPKLDAAGHPTCPAAEGRIDG